MQLRGRHIIPEHCRDGMELYITKGVSPGSFLDAVLCSDLVRAYAQADHINEARMRSYAEFLYAYAPSECWGSREIVDRWIESGGMEGREAA